MFIKQRKVRRPTKFQSKFATTARRRREYLASMYSMGVIQVLLLGSLLMGAWRSHVLMRDRFADLVWYARLALPFVMLALAALVLRSLIGNISRIREISAERRRPSER